MKPFGRILMTVAVAGVMGVTGGCTTPKLSDSLYRESEVGLAKSVVRCRVLAVREVEIRNSEQNNFGGAAGAILGGTAGSSAGGEGTVGRALAVELGVIAGAIIGNKLGDTMSGRKGLEYSVITANGEELTFVQEFLDDDRVIRVGDTCRMQVARDGRNRVLPAESLPETIQAPKQTTIVR